MGTSLKSLCSVWVPTFLGMMTGFTTGEAYYATRTNGTNAADSGLLSHQLRTMHWPLFYRGKIRLLPFMEVSDLVRLSTRLPEAARVECGTLLGKEDAMRQCIPWLVCYTMWQWQCMLEQYMYHCTTCWRAELAACQAVGAAVSR